MNDMRYRNEGQIIVGDTGTQHARDNEIDALEQKLARADARIAELERDAGRYRWLRKHHVRGPYIVDVDGCAISGEDADSDIDAARAGGGESGDGG